VRVRGMREGGMRLSRHCSDYDGPTALEPLAWGVGVFRASKTEQDTSYMKVTGGSPYPKVISPHMVVNLYHLISVEHLVGDDEGEGWTDDYVTETVPYESTNLILADSYGELEQLRRRKNDQEFLNKYLAQLKDTANFVEVCGVEGPSGIVEQGSDYSGAWLDHIKNGIWKAPPDSTSELSERVDYLLENTIVDRTPGKRITSYKHHIPLIY